MPATQDFQTLSTKVSPEMFAELQKIAENKQCSQSDVLKELVEDYLNSRAWFRAKVQRGLDDLEAGRTKSHEEVLANLRKRGLNVG